MQLHGHTAEAASLAGRRTPVLVVGSGPVGLTLACDLASRGITCTAAELRHFMELPSVKCNHVSARTMEQFRRLGFAHKVRALGLPDDHPNDIAFRTTLTGWEMSRVHIPSRRDRFTDTSGPDGGWQTPEPPHRINQQFLEPVLVEHAAAQPQLTLLNRVRIVGFSQDADSVRAEAEDLDTGAVFTIECEYLVGCDGARSAIRKAIDASLSGESQLKRVQSTQIRAPQLLAQLPGERAWGYYAFNARRCGTVFAIDGVERWIVHNSLRADEVDFESVDRDRCLREILGVGPDFEYESISKEDWVARRLVADKLRQGRVFIAGDAAHLWAPHAGYGMNAGIADAVDLGWMLAARLQGWAAPGLLDAYQSERLPITNQVSQFVAGHGSAKRELESNIPAALEEAGPAGAALRERWGRANHELHVRQFCAGGLNFGYFYDCSPVIAYDGEDAPPYTLDEFTPSTVPGCRAPHFWLADGRSLYDAFGPFYTLLRFDHRVDAAPLLLAASGAGVPVTLLDIDLKQVQVPRAYRHRLVLCRCDQHVAWRGDTAPADPAALIDRLRGAAGNQALADPGVRSGLQGLGYDPAPSGSVAEFREQALQEGVALRKTVEALGLKGD